MKKKKKVIFISLILICACIWIVIIKSFTSSFNGWNLVLFINENIYIPKPDNVDVIYMHDWREGVDLEIWYYNDKKINSIIKN
jgi:hypothetical protein